MNAHKLTQPNQGGGKKRKRPQKKKNDKKPKLNEDEPSANIPKSHSVLVLATRGIQQRERHLLNDLKMILPHNKKAGKFSYKERLNEINEIAESRNCPSCIFFEVTLQGDLFLWLSKTPEGPSCRFLVRNIHTIAELKLPGNSIKGSRAFLAFDKAFDAEPHLKLLKELFTQAFASPTKHRNTKRVIDHVLTFSIQDHKIWFRNYQIKQEEGSSEKELSEIGPRFVLDLYRIYEGSFSGSVLYANPHFQTPDQVRQARAKLAIAKSLSKRSAKVAEEETLKKPIFARTEQPEAAPADEEN